MSSSVNFSGMDIMTGIFDQSKSHSYPLNLAGSLAFLQGNFEAQCRHHREEHGEDAASLFQSSLKHLKAVIQVDLALGFGPLHDRLEDPGEQCRDPAPKQWRGFVSD